MKPTQDAGGQAGSGSARFSPVGPGLLVWQARVPAENVAWLRYVLEAEDGLAFMHSDGSGVVLLLCPEGRAREMRVLLADLLADGCLAEILSEAAGGQAPVDVI